MRNSGYIPVGGLSGPLEIHCRSHGLIWHEMMIGSFDLGELISAVKEHNKQFHPRREYQNSDREIDGEFIKLLQSLRQQSRPLKEE